MKKKEIKAAFNSILKPGKVNAFPYQLNIEITTHCNLNCESCLRKSLIAKPDHMTFEKYKYIVDTIKPQMLCLVGFGEPMMHPEFFDFIKYADNDKISVSVTTNGTLLNDESINEIFISGLKTLTISLDAPDEKTYTLVRKNNKFNSIIKNIIKINNEKKIRKTSYPNIVLHYVIYNYNYNKLNYFIEFSKQLEPSMIFFQPCEYYDSSNKQILTNNIDKETFKQEIQQANYESLKSGIKTNLFFWEKKFEYLWLKYNHQESQLPFCKDACVRPWISSYICIDGSVYLCCGLSVNHKQSIGNFFEENFETIWNSKKANNQRKNIKSGKKTLKGCSTCVPLSFYDEYKIFRSKKMKPPQ
ncbi:radical SAM protein [Candidatus Magnetomorum sp. HK-1]|nr:radical SAM protein [Candidatus Magnetomorum sp. HK-1]